MPLTERTKSSDRAAFFGLRLSIPVILAAIGFIVLAAGSHISATPINALDLGYFKGTWTVAMRDNPERKFSWTVKEDLNKSWLSGVVEQNGQRVSTDFWRVNGKKIERFAFTGNGIFVQIESAGWDGDKMTMTGILSNTAGETKVRETITKVSEREFNALWEMEGPDGKWTVFGDEICTKN